MISIYEERGEVKGQRRMLLSLLRSKFGTLPEQIVTRVEAIPTTDELERISARLLTANSLEDMGLTEN